jgi:hypothetical protein
MPPREADAPVMAIGVEAGGESFGLLIDSIGKVLQLADVEREPNPPNLDPRIRTRVEWNSPPRWAADEGDRRRPRARDRARGGGGIKKNRGEIKCGPV